MSNDIIKKVNASAMMFIVVVVLFFPVMNSQENQANLLPLDNTNWWNTTWPYRKLITIDHTNVASDLTNFPVVINISQDTDLATRAQDDGDDITFILYSDNTTQLNHELELFNGTTGRTVAWVNVTSLSATQDTKIWMYYGNETCSNQQNIEGTWDPSFLAVHHLGETTGTAYDSTSHHNDGTPYGNLSQNVTGKINGADSFDGIDDHITVPQIYTNENQFTLEAWIYAQAGARYFISQWNNYYGVFLQVGANPDHIEWYIDSATGGISGITLNTWYHIVLTYDGSTARIYLNGGTPVSSVCAAPSWPSEGMYLGDRSAGGRQFHGTIDEVRCSNIARISGWITTCCNNQNSPESFVSIGAEEPYEYTLTLTVDPTGGGTIAASPAPPYHYNDVVTLTATANPGYTFSHWSGDLTGNLNPATLLIDGNKTVIASFIFENMLPVAVNDSATVLENSTNTSIDVLANDYDPDGDNLTIISVTQPVHGVSSQDGSSVYYTPPASYTGSDSFTYNISDGQGGNASATVFITVIPVNNPPYMPSHPNPDNGDTNVSITTDLGWSGGDPDPDDIVRYDVYFGTTSSPSLVSSNQSTSTYDLGILTYDTTYYWRIVSWDTYNVSAEGVLWHFTTQKEEEGIVVNITRPLDNSFYLRNFRLFSLPRNTIVYGPITIKAKVTADARVNRVEFYIDGKLRKIDIMPPYTYHWAPLRSFKHIIMVQAYDTAGHTASDELTVFKWRLHPLVLMGGALLLSNSGK